MSPGSGGAGRSEDVLGPAGGGVCVGGSVDDRETQRGYGCGVSFRNAKKVAVIRFRKLQKRLRRRNHRPANASSSSFTTVCLDRRVDAGCHWCFKPTPTLDSPVVESQRSDPNSPEFGPELLRALIEKNDFYSKDCNPHLGQD